MGPLIKNEFFEVTLTWRWKNFSKRARMRTYGAKYLVRGYAYLSEERVREFPSVSDARKELYSLAEEDAVTRLARNFDTEAGDNWGGWSNVSVVRAGHWYVLERFNP